MKQVVAVESSKPIDDACWALQKAAADHQFGVLHVHNLRQTLASKGVPFDREVRVFNVCNPQQAKRALEKDPLLSAALPCSISVFSDAGKTKFAFVRPTATLGLFGSPELDPIARQVEQAITAIVEAAAG